ncbi:MAG: TetR/AcrR family transcriptional regulator [Candidatus Nanopelagicales bacterium]
MANPPRTRMSGTARREQLIRVGRQLFAEKGYEAVTVEEVAAEAGVSKPVVYEHFGGKEGLYAVVVDREMADLLGRVERALAPGPPKTMLESVVLAWLDYIATETEGFRVLVRDSPGVAQGSFASLLRDIAGQVSVQLAAEFDRRGYQAKQADMYAQMLVGMVTSTGMWWVDVRKPKREELAAHLVNLAWNGLSHLEPKPKLG